MLTKGVALYLIRHFHFSFLFLNFPGKQERAKEVVNEFRCGMMNTFSVYTCIYLGRWSNSDTFRYASYCFHAHHLEGKKKTFIDTSMLRIDISMNFTNHNDEKSVSRSLTENVLTNGNGPTNICIWRKCFIL